jgi:hypothetical protein
MVDLVYLGPTDGIVYTGVNGRIGIGTSSPQSAFDVSTEVGNTTGIFGDYNPICLIKDYACVGFNAYYNGAWKAYTGGKYTAVISLASMTGVISVWTGNAPASHSTATITERMTILNDGKIGIGTTNPTEKLEVNGNIKCANMTVTSWTIQVPDYVFDREHKLQRLEELSEYVHREKHLPEMPSADDMRSQGINLADMNLRLLKKVEELTLHLIEQNQRIKKLERTRIGTRIVNFLMRLVGL